MGVSIIKAVQERLGFAVKMSYGLSEAGAVTVQLSDSWDDHQKILGSVGTVIPGVEIKMVSMNSERKSKASTDLFHSIVTVLTLSTQSWQKENRANS